MRSRSTTCSARCSASTATARSRPTIRSTGSASGKNRAICALGLRNPFTFAFNPGAVADVHQRRRPEHVGRDQRRHRRAPTTDGRTPKARRPTRASSARRYAYNHSGGGCAITGGAFYAPAIHAVSRRVPQRLLLRRLLRRLDPQARSRGRQQRRDLCDRHLVSGRSQGRRRRQPVLPRARLGGTTGVVYRISYTASAPSITTHPSSQTVAPGASVTFSVRASGPPPLRYQWQRNGVNISGATAQDYTIRRRRGRQRRAVPRHRQQRRRQRHSATRPC